LILLFQIELQFHMKLTGINHFVLKCV